MTNEEQKPQASVGDMISGAIRKRRKALGMTQKQLASQVGVLQPNIARLESSKKAGSIRIGTLAAAARGLKSDIEIKLVPWKQEVTEEPMSVEAAAECIAQSLKTWFAAKEKAEPPEVDT